MLLNYLSNTPGNIQAGARSYWMSLQTQTRAVNPHVVSSNLTSSTSWGCSSEVERRFCSKAPSTRAPRPVYIFMRGGER